MKVLHAILFTKELMEGLIMFDNKCIAFEMVTCSLSEYY